MSSILAAYARFWAWVGCWLNATAKRKLWAERGTVPGGMMTLKTSHEVRDLEFGVAVLGQFRLLRGMNVVRVPRASQRLLAFLALHDRIVERAALAGALWPEASQSCVYSGRTPADRSEMITRVSPDGEPGDLTLLTLCDQPSTSWTRAVPPIGTVIEQLSLRSQPVHNRCYGANSIRSRSRVVARGMSDGRNAWTAWVRIIPPRVLR